ADTVEPYNEYEVKGTGFAFDNYNAHEMMHIIEYALTVYRERPEHMKALIRQAMTRDFSWTQSAKRYSELYASIDR
ncbi:MAG: starch synthase, partial [Clostridia bacterium]|nr:starch synthase [Clostridia bacterium]